jgi:hypothetical protein
MSTRSGVNYRPNADMMPSGWTLFGAVMLVLVGGFTIIDGFVGLYKPSYYVVPESHLLLWNFQTWGWINLIGGILLVLAGLSLFTGAFWARMAGILLAALNAFAQVAFIAAFPVWAVVVIAVDIIVIYALAVNRQVATT